MRNNIGNKIPKLLQITPPTAIFLPSCVKRFISLKPTNPRIKPMMPNMMPTSVRIEVTIDRMPRIKEAIAFPLVTLLFGTSL